MFPVAILAGGLATRLRPITETIPKALVDVAGQPFVNRQLRYLRTQGITKVVLCVGYLAEQIESVVGDGSQFGLEVHYSHDGPKLLGTGGALRQALPSLGNKFFVLYGDSFLPVDFASIQRAYCAAEKPALMTVLRNENRWDKSNVLFQDGRLTEYNKQNPSAEMDHIDYGLGIVSDQVLTGFPLGEPFDLADIYHKLSLQGLLAGFEVNERFYEIGSYSGLQEAAEYFCRKDAE
jgi:MurNAc alpha-1-phosphate uridylyltransferase